MSSWKYHIIRILFTVFVFLTAAWSVHAAETDYSYSGPVDPETNQPADSGDKENTGRVQLSSTMYYDWNSRDFVYPINGTLNEVHASAADGMISNQPVSISTGADVSVLVYLNGKEYTGSLKSISSPGDYVVSARQGSDTKRVFSFTLVGKTTNVIQNFTPPDGFYVTDALRDGEPIYFDRYNVVTAEEGLYHIEYECLSTDIVYTLETTIDRTPPALTFSGRIRNNGQVRSALDFSGLEAGDSIVLYRGQEIVQPTYHTDGTGTIYDTGTYLMNVFDAAGNKTEYRFVIMMYFNVSSLIFILLAAGIVISVGVYMFVKGKRLKIG